MSAGTNFGPVLLLLLFGLLGVGGWLLLTARRRAEGQEPHCLMCGYNLTGLDSERCPECGVELTADMRSCGPPSEMRWGRFMVGLVIVLGIFLGFLWSYFAGRTPVVNAFRF